MSPEDCSIRHMFRGINVQNEKILWQYHQVYFSAETTVPWTPDLSASLHAFFTRDIHAYMRGNAQLESVR